MPEPATWRRARTRSLAGVLALALTSWAGGSAYAASLIDTSTVSGHYSASHFYVHFANGYYWVAVNRSNQATLYSSRDGASWTSLGAIFGFTFAEDSNAWAVRYLGNTVIAAGFNSGDDTRYYRRGTLEATGGISWDAVGPIGPANAADPDLNILFANGRPVVWRAGLTGNGAFWRGTALSSPTWSALPGSVPAYGLGASGFSAGAIFRTRGSDQDDLIVLRAFTQTAYTPTTHRLMALKWDASAGAYDGSWYSVSTLGGTLTEDSNTDVQPNDDATIQRKFAAVADTLGNIHAVYVGRSTRVQHYKKDVGFNDSWSRVSSDVLAGDGAAKVALSAVANGQLILFYEKNTTQRDIWYRRFDGTSWSGETLLYPGSALATDLRRAIATQELASDCLEGIGFTTGSSPPFNVNFSLGVGGCSALSTLENAGAGTVTVTGLGSFETVFTRAAGGSIEQLYDLVEDPGKVLDLAGSLASSTSPRGLHNFGLQVGAGNFFNSGANDLEARLQLLEATSTRVRVRQDAFYQNAPGGPRLGGVKGYGDYSVYPSGRIGLRWERRVTAPLGVSYLSEFKEIFVHRLAAGPLLGWTSFSDTALMPPNGPGGSDFVLAQNETAGTPGARTDVLDILHRDWSTAAGHFNNADATGSTTTPSAERVNLYWFEANGETNGLTLPNGRSDVWNSLTYIKPTTLTNQGVPAVTGRSSDYRNPAAPGITTGTSWQDPDEFTGSDNFNEAEAAYLFTLDPAAGLKFDLDGLATTRYQPFFKIRQWRSTNPPQSIRFDPDSGGAAAQVTLVRNVDYRADVKPVSRASFADDLRWHATFEDNAAVTTPDVGSAAALAGGVGPAAGKYGQGFDFNAAGKEVTFTSSGDFNVDAGAVEFWYKPDYDHADNTEHRLWTYQVDVDHQFILRKQSTNELLFEARNGPGGANWTWARVLPANYSWRRGDWVHVRVAWDVSAVLGEQLRIYLNGVEPLTADTGPLFNPLPANWPDGGTFRIGLDSNGLNPASGVIDELHLYSSAVAPGPGSALPDPSGQSGLAHGGLTTDSTEYLATTARNFTLDFHPVDGAITRRGEYVYFGSDSKYRGLNVALATNGASGGTLSVQWQFWNGAQWSNLAVTDQTLGFTRNGTVYWTGDPFGWKPYSVNGGPDLYYVRAYLTSTSAAYSTPPAESVVTTDVLLFQYCADVTTDDEEFTFGAPVTTAVKLQSFEATPADAAVELAWRTASELDNLGFHLYRSLSAAGPWSRVTPSLVPGLGSSPVGAAYSWRDSGLENGTRYFYRLEDVDTASVSTFHGPVSAVPQPGAPGPSGPSTDDDGSRRAPGLELPPCGKRAAPPCVRSYGDPRAVSARVVERARDSVVVELRTFGFEAVHEADGRVWLRIPGFEDGDDPEAAALPFKRVLLDAPVGKGARLAWTRELAVRRVPGLAPSALGFPEMELRADGTVRPRRRPARLRGERSARSRRPAAALGEPWFLGERKQVPLELFPLSPDASGGGVRRSRRLLGKVEFAGREARESGRGTRGRRRPRQESPTGGTLAFLHVAKPGLYGVRFEAVFPGSGRGVALDQLSLERQGEPVPYHVEPSRGSFAPGGVLYFHAEQGPTSTAHQDELAYALVRASGGLPMASLAAAPRGKPVATGSLARAAFETNRIYQPGLLDAPDPWLWEALVGGSARTVPFDLAGLDSSQPLDGRLTVWLQGASDAEDVVDHHLELLINGVAVGDAIFDGKRAFRFEAALAASLLRPGTNELTLVNVADTGVNSLAFLDRFELDYPQASALRDGVFEGAWGASGVARLARVGSGPVLAVDVTEPARPARLSGVEPGAGVVELRVESGRRYRLANTDAVASPRVSAPVATTLRSAASQADYLVIAPDAFREAARPLVERRRAQGLTTRLATLEEIASAFGHGEVSGDAIRAFLGFAYQEWQKPSPRYVLLLGDASYDPRHFMGGTPSPLPARFVRTSYLVTASDPSLAAVNGDDPVPDLAIGRLPAQTAEQAQALVQKLLDWEDSGQGLSGRALLVADNPDDAGDFEADIVDVRDSFLSGHDPQTVFLSREGPNTRARILEALDLGASYVGYAGHGGAAVWATENVLNSWDVASLRAQSQQGVMLTFNCLNGYFVAPGFDSLAEAFLKAEGRGTIASFSPSGLSVDGPAHRFHRALVAELVSGRHERLGDAVRAAQEAYAETGLMPELLSVYHLFGDPALSLR